MPERAVPASPVPPAAAGGPGGLRSREALLGLAFLSGVCGLAYEVLYSRLLTTYLGDMFYVNGSVLTCFLLMLGIGARWAHRFAGRLWAIELLLGLYAVAAGLGARLGQDAFLQHVTPLAASPAAAFLLVLAMLAVPAALSGLSVPLFALWLRHAPGGPADASRAFRAVYACYNLGAALCVLGVEFVLLHTLGLARTLLAMAVVNLAVAAVLRRSGAPPAALAPGPAAAWPGPWPGAHPAVIGVLVLGVASGVAQLLVLRLAITLFGPYHENFTLVVALGLAAISLGAWVVQRTDWSFARLASLGAVVVPGGFLLWTVAILLWGEVNGLVANVWLHRLLRIGVLAVGGGLILTVFGATIPAALRGQPDDRAGAGRLLAAASFGNAAGYLVTLLLLQGRFTDRGLVVVVGVLVLGVAALAAREGGAGRATLRRAAAPALGVLALGAALAGWPTRLLQFSHLHLSSGDARRGAEAGLRTAAWHRSYGHQVTVLRNAAGSEQLVIDGYLSLVIPPEGRAQPQEFVVGAAPAFFARERRHALVLGVGTGITAGATTLLFDRVTAVEINPAVLEALPRYASRNNGLASHPRAEILLQDGLTLLARQTGRYDAIINTVTSPRFFSSSKLYTRDFFDLAARNLAPGGVYACWFDNEIGPAGAAIVLATLRESFPHVAFLLLRAGYFLVLGAREPLAFAAAPPVDAGELARAYARLDAPLPLPDLVRALMVGGTDVLARAGPGAAVNTLDLPALEFALTRTPPGRDAGPSVRQFLGLDFESSWAGPPGPAPGADPRAAARALALLTLREPAAAHLVRRVLAAGGFRDPAWGALLPSLLRHARLLSRPELALGWAEALLESDRPAQAELTLQGWVERVGSLDPARFRRGLEYAHWLRARLLLQGGGPLPEPLRDGYLTALRGARFPYLERPGRDAPRAAWEGAIRAALAHDWTALPPAAGALARAADALDPQDAADLRRLAWLLHAAAARAGGDDRLALEHLERVVALRPLDPLARLELLRALPAGTPAHEAHRAFLARLGPPGGASRPLLRLLALVRRAGGPVPPWEAERF